MSTLDLFGHAKATGSSLVAIPPLDLRGYQSEACEAVEAAHGRSRGALVVLPTGAGKTRVAAAVARQRVLAGQRVLVLTPTITLCDQMYSDLWGYGLRDIGKEQADNRVRRPFPAVVVASVATMRGERLKRFAPNTFGLVIGDEAHRSPSPSQLAVFDYFALAKRLGLTATPCRVDGVSLANVFDETAYQMSMLAAIEAGWLVPIKFKTAITDFDAKALRTLGGEVTASSVESEIVRAGLLHEAANTLAELAAGERTVAFLPTVASSKAFVGELVARGVSAEHVDGTTPREVREEVFARFSGGETRVLSNVAVLCLDSETEILTKSGWVGIDGMTPEHDVAAWSDGEIRFERPTAVHRRRRMPGERMVRFAGERLSVRVTEGHALVHSRGADHHWAKSPARALVGRAVQLPTAGRCRPLVFEAERPATITSKRRARLLTAARYNLRHGEHWPEDDVQAEAERRLARKLSLRHKAPHELTQDECRLIGFWLGDGTKNKLRSGGVEFVVSESLRNPYMLDWIESLLRRLGLDFVVRDKARAGDVPRRRWSLSRGTGSGPQQRNGVYAIEKFLERDGSELLWGLDREQLECLLEGLWLADGDHGQGGPLPEWFVIHGSNKTMLDAIQALCVCRGMTAGIRKNGAPGRRSAGDKQMYRLRIHRTKTKFTMGNDAFEFEASEDASEIVWCVTVPSGNIVTRRNGLVLIMGNCEGWDMPMASVIALLSPTKSWPRLVQMIGRGTRLAPGKTHALIIDFCPGRMRKGRLASPADALAGRMLDDAVHEQLAKDGDLAEAIKDAEQTVEDLEAKRQARAEAARRKAEKAAELAHLATKKQFSYGVQEHDAHDILGGAGAGDRGVSFMDSPEVTEEEKNAWRRKRGLCTEKQAKILAKHGMNPFMTRDLARVAMDAIANNGWRCPPELKRDTRFYRKSDKTPADLAEALLEQLRTG